MCFFCLNIKVIVLVFISLQNNTGSSSWAFVGIYLGINSHHTAFTHVVGKIVQ